MGSPVRGVSYAREVVTQLGQFTEIRIILPRAAALPQWFYQIEMDAGSSPMSAIRTKRRSKV